MSGIKYIGPVFDSSGYANATREYIYSLHNKGVPLTVIPHCFEHNQPAFGDNKKRQTIHSLIGKEIDYDVVIAQLTPDMALRHKENGKHNISYFAWETSVVHPDWVACLNQMSEIWVPCQWNLECVKASGVERPVYKIPHGIDTDKFDQIEDSKLELNGINNDTYVFYNISQWNPRKNPETLLRAYFNAFRRDDNVALVLKTYIQNGSDREVQFLADQVKRIKIDMDLNNYPKVVLITSLMTEKQILELHNRCDCLVSLHYCWDKNTEVLTDRGLTKIVDVRIGDRVLSHTGTWRPVVNTFRNKRDGRPMLSVQLSGSKHEDFICTDNHKVLAIKCEGQNFPSNPVVEEKMVKELDKTYALVFPKQSRGELNTYDSEKGLDLARIYGYFLAEGSTRKDGIVFSINKNEKNIEKDICDSMKNVYGLEPHTRVFTRNRKTITFYSSVLRDEFRKLFYVGDTHTAHYKRIPQEVIEWFSEKQCASLLLGYLNGDGYHRDVKKDNDPIIKRQQAPTSVSKTLIIQLRYILYSLGIASTLHKRSGVPGKTSDSWKLLITNIYFEKLCGILGKKVVNKVFSTNNRQKDYGKFFAVKVRDVVVVENYNDEYVYSIEVEDDHTYCVNGFVSRNSEGWGLVPFDAGLAGNPVIATGATGNMEYMTKENSYPVDYRWGYVRGMSSFNRWYRGDGLWAEPSDMHAVELMRYVFENRDKAKEKGERLKTDIKENFAWDAVSQCMINRLKQLEV